MRKKSKTERKRERKRETGVTKTDRLTETRGRMTDGDRKRSDKYNWTEKGIA